ncbi:MAG: hypothetical protein AAB696_00485 [Patescibacteria group bacterium]
MEHNILSIEKYGISTTIEFHGGKESFDEFLEKKAREGYVVNTPLWLKKTTSKIAAISSSVSSTKKHEKKRRDIRHHPIYSQRR